MMYLSWLHDRKGSLIPRCEALRMAETRRACPHASGPSGVLTCAPRAIRIGSDIINNVVGMAQIARNSPNPQEVVQRQIVAHAPGDVVIRAGGVAAYTHSSDEDPIGGVQCEPAAKHVHTANFVAHHGIAPSAVLGGRSRVRDARIHGVTLLKTKEAASRLHGAK